MGVVFDINLKIVGNLLLQHHSSLQVSYVGTQCPRPKLFRLTFQKCGTYIFHEPTAV